MNTDRWAEIDSVLKSETSTKPVGDRIANVANKLLEAVSSSVTVWSMPQFLILASTDERALALDQSQLVLGEGPIYDTHEADSPVFTPDTHGDDCVERWPMFSTSLHMANVSSLITFPMQAGAAHIGAISAYRDHIGGPTIEMYRDGLILASLATESILLLKAGVPDGHAIADFEPALRNDAVIQQAAGMASEQLSISVLEAMVIMRSRAFSTDTTLLSIATAIVSRELTLEI